MLRISESTKPTPSAFGDQKIDSVKTRNNFINRGGGDTVRCSTIEKYKIPPAAVP